MTIIERSDCAEGAYGFNRATHLLVDEESGRGVLVADHWCGKPGDLEGECYRPHLYYLADGRSAVAAWDGEPASDDNGWVSAWTRWYNDMLYDASKGRRFYGDPKKALARYIRRQSVAANRD